MPFYPHFICMYVCMYLGDLCNIRYRHLPVLMQTDRAVKAMLYLQDVRNEFQPVLPI